MATLTEKPLVSDQVVDSLAEEAKAIVEKADYSECPVEGQGTVNKFLVLGVSALIHNARNGNSSKGDKGAWGFLRVVGTKTPWAVVVMMAFWMIARAAGWIG